MKISKRYVHPTNVYRYHCPSHAPSFLNLEFQPGTNQREYLIHCTWRWLSSARKQWLCWLQLELTCRHVYILPLEFPTKRAEAALDSVVSGTRCLTHHY